MLTLAEWPKNLSVQFKQFINSSYTYNLSYLHNICRDAVIHVVVVVVDICICQHHVIIGAEMMKQQRISLQDFRLMTNNLAIFHFFKFIF